MSALPWSKDEFEQRLRAWLGELEACFAPHRAGGDEPLYLQIEVVRPAGSNPVAVHSPRSLRP